MKIIVVTDHTPNRNGFASPQTLHNFLQLLQADYLIVAHAANMNSQGLDPLYKNVITYKDRFNIAYTNRLDNWIAPLRTFLNEKWVRTNSKAVKKALQFQADTLLIVPNSINSIRFADLFSQKVNIKTLIYFMDDYQFYESPEKAALVKRVINHSSGAFFISESLKTVFYNRYQINFELPYFYAHNPVNLKKLQPLAKVWQTGETLSIAYAGSIYPNHRDSLELLVKTLTVLKGKGIVCKITMFTQPVFWESFYPGLAANEQEVIEYGGQIKYDDLHKLLQTFHIGLITESHLEELRAMATSSLQTKVNDYLLSGLPIWCIGPKYGVCGNFIEDNGIGQRFISSTVIGLVAEIEKGLNRTEMELLQQNARTFFVTFNDNNLYKKKLENFLLSTLK